MGLCHISSFSIIEKLNHINVCHINEIIYVVLCVWLYLSKFIHVIASVTIYFILLHGHFPLCG